MKKTISILLGLIFLVVPIYAWGSFSTINNAAVTFLEGGVVWLMLFIGLILVILGINSLKD